MTTIADIEHLCQTYSELRSRKDELSKTLSGLEDEISAVSSKIIESLDSSGKERWDINGVGTISVVHRFTYKVPKTPDQKEQFFGFLKEKGIFEDLISVNSQTLNAFAKREMELAKESGATDFSIPGLEEPALDKTIQLRRQK